MRGYLASLKDEDMTAQMNEAGPTGDRTAWRDLVGGERVDVELNERECSTACRAERLSQAMPVFGM